MNLTTEAHMNERADFLQTGDPKSLYPQVLKNAESRPRAHEAWKLKTGLAAEDEGGVASRCGL